MLHAESSPTTSSNEFRIVRIVNVLYKSDIYEFDCSISGGIFLPDAGQCLELG
jgi:hypothetical protein